MDIFDRSHQFTFRTKTLAEEFCKRMRDMAYKIDVVTVNDILKDRGEAKSADGYRYGYDKKTIRKMKAEKAESGWVVIFPKPSKLVRDEHGYWTTENVKLLDKLNEADWEEGG